MRAARHILLLISFALFCNACALSQMRKTHIQIPPTVERLAPADWPAIEDDLSPESFALAGEESMKYLRAKDNALYSFGAMRIGSQRLIDTIEELKKILASPQHAQNLRAVLIERFELYRINRSTHPHSAHYSSYYQPVLEASPERTSEFNYPIYKKPPDMIEAPLEAFDKKLAGRTLIGRLDDAGRFVPYFNRRDIDIRDALAGKGLEIAWLKSAFDRLNLHIQGSGLLRYPDGSEVMARFAATSAHPYKSVGMAVVGSGAMSRADITSKKLEQYLKEHPEGEAWLISQNPRYTFFELFPLSEREEPPGSIGRPLTAGRSIAVDPKYTPLGAVAYISLPLLQADKNGNWLGERPSTRFVHCQDTGGAIQGPGRVDIYMGHGSQAKATAHNVWEQGDMYILLKKYPPRDR